MFKKGKMLAYVFVLLLLLVGCSGGYDNHGDDGESGGTDSSLVISNVNRKIIYTAHLSIKTNDLLDTTNQIKSGLESDEWIESEDLGSNSNYIVVRVETTRLNDFIDWLRGDYETTNFKLESRDVSLDYLDTTAKKDALLLERDRLMELYAEASINEMILINQRIGEIDTELIKLERRLLEYDSLIDYSTVRIWIYGPLANPNPPSYGNRLQNTFIDGWNAVVAIVQGVIQIIVFILPFSVILVPAGVITVFVLHRRKIKRKDHNDREN